ncbi:MAG: LacI family DNA-binding transcriptional regulator [Spirochaetota bacterium]|jgi:DNA-binding LacI/PurR family transcriptional regulator
MTPKRPRRLDDIARVCGVSASTVSRVLSNAPGIAAGTRRRVLEAVEASEFSPRKRRRHISRSSIRLSVVIPGRQRLATNPFFDPGELVVAINNAFGEAPREVALLTYDDLGASIESPGFSTDGFIFAFGDIDDGMRARLREGDIPYIFLNRAHEGESSVSCNNFRGMLRLGRHLVERGYRRIGYLDCADNVINADRYRGFLVAMTEAGVRGFEENVYRAEEIAAVDAKTASFFADRRCDAVMCFNDNFAIRLISHFREMGVGVPGDVAVTGFDRSPAQALFRPSIATISLSTYEMAFLAARWLRDNIEQREARTMCLEVEGAFIEGESVGWKGGRHE